MLRLAVGAIAVALAVMTTEPAAAQRVKAGLLTCDVSGGIGFIIGSSMAHVARRQNLAREIAGFDSDGDVRKRARELQLCTIADTAEEVAADADLVAGAPILAAASSRRGPAVSTPPTSSSAHSVVVMSRTPAIFPDSTRLSSVRPPVPVA